MRSWRIGPAQQKECCCSSIIRTPENALRKNSIHSYCTNTLIFEYSPALQSNYRHRYPNTKQELCTDRKLGDANASGYGFVDFYYSHCFFYALYYAEGANEVSSK